MVDRKCDINGKWETVNYALKCKPLSREESERRRKAFLIGHKVSTAEVNTLFSNQEVNFSAR